MRIFFTLISAALLSMSISGIVHNDAYHESGLYYFGVIINSLTLLSCTIEKIKE